MGSPHWDTVRLKLGRAATEKKSNAAVLTDDEIAEVISTSTFYVDNIEDICGRLGSLKDASSSKTIFMEWAKRTLPCGPRLSSKSPLTVVSGIVQIACYNLFAFHLGLRISEMLSAKRGFVYPSGTESKLNLDQVELEVTTYKSVEEIYGAMRVFSVHPYLSRVAHALELLNDTLNLESNELFTTITGDIIYETNNFNFRIDKFCMIHGIDVHQTSHTWRHTLVGVALRCLKNPTGPLSLLLGHNPNQSVAYGFGNPFIRAELLEEFGRMQLQDNLDFISQSKSFGGEGLGGRQGTAIEAGLAAANENGEAKVSAIRLADDLSSQGIHILDVAPGKQCVRPPFARGFCSSFLGGALPDTANCSARCAYQGQTEIAFLETEQLVQRIPVILFDPDVEYMEKIRIVGQLEDQLLAWPELKSRLVSLLDLHTDLRIWFEED